MVLLHRHVILCGVVFLSFVAAHFASARTWTDTTGKFRIDAEFVSLVDGTVTLKKPDGSSTRIPLEKLSKSDQDYVQQAIKQTKPPTTEGKPTSSKTVGGPDALKGTKDVQVVVGEGAGSTPDEALKDAFRNAVRQVVGAVVDAETLIKNDEVIDDKVLTYSDGFIKGYEEVAGSKQNKGGLHRIKIKAQVERRSVIAKLKAANVTIKEVDGKGLFAEAVTQLDAEKDAAALLTKQFEGFPQNYFTISVLNKPKLIEKNETMATVEINVQVEADYDAYKAFAKRLVPIIDKMAVEQRECLVTYKLVSEREQSFFAPTNGRWWAYFLEDHFSNKALRECETGTCAGLYLCRNGTNNSDRLEYRCYLLDKSLLPVLSRVCNQECKGKLTLLDKSGETVTSDEFAIAERGHSSFSMQFGNGHTKNIFVISPTFQKGGNDRAHKPKLSISRNISLSLDELKSIDKAIVELVQER